MSLVVLLAVLAATASATVVTKPVGRPQCPPAGCTNTEIPGSYDATGAFGQITGEEPGLELDVQGLYVICSGGNISCGGAAFYGIYSLDGAPGFDNAPLAAGTYNLALDFSGGAPAGTQITAYTCLYYQLVSKNSPDCLLLPSGQVSTPIELTADSNGDFGFGGNLLFDTGANPIVGVGIEFAVDNGLPEATFNQTGEVTSGDLGLDADLDLTAQTPEPSSLSLTLCLFPILPVAFAIRRKKARER